MSTFSEHGSLRMTSGAIQATVPANDIFVLFSVHSRLVPKSEILMTSFTAISTLSQQRNIINLNYLYYCNQHQLKAFTGGKNYIPELDDGFRCLPYLDGLLWPWPFTSDLKNLIWSSVGASEYSLPYKFHPDCSNCSWDMVFTRFDLDDLLRPWSLTSGLQNLIRSPVGANEYST